MSARKQIWENAFSGRQLDSVRNGILVVLTTGLILVNEHNHPLLLQKARHRPSEESLTYFALHEERVLRAWKAENRVKISLEERARNLHVSSGTLPCAWITSLNLDASMVTGVCFYTLSLVGSPVKSQRTLAEKDRWPHWRRLFNIASEKVYSGGRWKIGIKSHSQVLEDHDASRKNSGNEWSTAGNHSKMRPSGASSVGSKFEERMQNETPHARAVRPRSSLGTWLRMSVNSERSHKIRSTLLPKLG